MYLDNRKYSDIKFAPPPTIYYGYNYKSVSTFELQRKFYKDKLKKLEHFLRKTGLYLDDPSDFYKVQAFLIETDYYYLDVALTNEYLLYPPHFESGDEAHFPKKIFDEEYFKLYYEFATDFINNKDKKYDYISLEKLIKSTHDKYRDIYSSQPTYETTFSTICKELKDVLEENKEKQNVILTPDENDTNRVYLYPSNLEFYHAHKTDNEELIKREYERKMALLVDYFIKRNIQTDFWLLFEIRILLLNNYFLPIKADKLILDKTIAYHSYNYHIKDKITVEKHCGFNYETVSKEIVEDLTINIYELSKILGMEDSIIFDIRTFEFDMDKVSERIKQTKQLLGIKE